MIPKCTDNCGRLAKDLGLDVEKFSSLLYMVGVKISNDRYFVVSKFRILKKQKISYSIFYFRIYFLFEYLFKLFKHLKYMLIYKIVNSWNFDRFPNCSILKIWCCSKLDNFRNLMFVEIAKFGKFF